MTRIFFILIGLVFVIFPGSAFAGGDGVPYSHAYLFCPSVSLSSDSIETHMKAYAVRSFSPEVIESIKTLSKDLGFSFSVYYPLSEKLKLPLSCKEYTLSVQALLEEEIRNWEYEAVSDSYEKQGSIFIFIPYSEKNERLIKKANIYSGIYTKLNFKVRDNWIVAYTAQAFFHRYRELIFFACFMLVIGLVFGFVKMTNKSDN